MSKDATVSISVHEYLDLKRSARKLEALEDNGVDNWVDYGIAMSVLEDDEGDL